MHTYLTKIAAFMLVFVIILTTVACEHGSQVYKCRIVKAPSRTEYPVGYSGTIDMNGIKVVGVRYDGKEVEHNYVFKSYDHADADIASQSNALTVYWDVSEVDFSTLGQYPIHLHFLGNKQISDTFYINVVEEPNG